MVKRCIASSVVSTMLERLGRWKTPSGLGTHGKRGME